MQKINTSASRSGREVKKAYSLFIQIPTLHANLSRDASRACQSHSLLSNVLTFLSCWRTWQRGEGYSCCATMENTRRDYVRGRDILEWAVTCAAPSLLWGSVRRSLRQTPEVGATRGLNWCLDAASIRVTVKRLTMGSLYAMQQRRHYQCHTAPYMAWWRFSSTQQCSAGNTLQ